MRDAEGRVSDAAMLPLPRGWAEPRRFCQEVVAGRMRLRFVSLSTFKPGIGRRTASAVAETTWPWDGAARELLAEVACLEVDRQGGTVSARLLGTELDQPLRVSELFPASESPELWEYAVRGVAVAEGREDAEREACLELAKLDAVVRCWRGETRPAAAPLDLDDARGDEALREIYELRAVTFPQTAWPECRVVGLFGLPRQPELPVVFGLGASLTAAEARARARRALLWRMAAFWGEPSSELPPFVPTRLFHLEAFLHSRSAAPLVHWLDGGHRRAALSLVRHPGRVQFLVADITPPALIGRSVVIKAVSKQCVPLVFGQAPEWLLPRDLWIHPFA